MEELTDEEKEVLAYLDEKEVIECKGRKARDYSDEAHVLVEERLIQVLKELVYKNRANFSITGMDNPNRYLFLSRKLHGGKRF